MERRLSCMSPASQLPCNVVNSAAPILRQPPSATLKHCLEHLLHSLPSRWIYAIFWSISTLKRHPSQNALADRGHAALSWGEGVLRSGETDTLGVATEIAITDLQWFYLASQGRSYSIDAGSAAVLERAWVSGAHVWLSGEIQLKMLGCERCREAQLHGIATLVCIPTDDGVLELASPEVSDEDWTLVEQAKAALSLAVIAEAEPAGRELMSFPPMAPSNNKVKHRAKSRSGSQASVSPVEAERHRRERLKHRLYELRSVVPLVSKLDRASVLEDAVAYIKELRERVRDLEAKVEISSRDGRSVRETEVTTAGARAMGILGAHGLGRERVEADVKLVEGEAVIVVWSRDEDHPAARVMDVLSELGMKVHSASVGVVGELLLQKVVATTPLGLKTEEALKTAFLSRLLDDN